MNYDYVDCMVQHSLDMEQVRREMITDLEQELSEIDQAINDIDAQRTKLLHAILEKRLHYDEVVKSLGNLGADVDRY